MITAALLICLAPLARDGDTIRCGNLPGRDVRIFGIESPDKTEQDRLNMIALSQKATGGLICEMTGNSYYRTVGRCWNAKGIDIGKEMLLEKRVTEWCQYSKNYYGTCLSGASVAR